MILCFWLLYAPLANMVWARRAVECVAWRTIFQRWISRRDGFDTSASGVSYAALGLRAVLGSRRSGSKSHLPPAQTGESFIGHVFVGGMVWIYAGSAAGFEPIGDERCS